MKDKDLLKKLNNLKNIKPDDNWKNNYRELLYSQISAGQTTNEKQSNLKTIWETIMPGKIFMSMAKPVWVTSLASILILIIGIGGVYASKNSKPGDSLYIAKIISEKAQFAITFNEKEKAKLGLEFATNRAKEITQVLEESKESEDNKDKKVEQLTQNFKKEINQVKDRLTIIKASENQTNQQAEETEVFGANLGKTDRGLEVSEPIAPVGGQVKLEIKEETVPELKLESPTEAVATTTEENLSNSDEALKEAEKMFDEKDYNGTITKIEEVKQIMDKEANAEKGQVKGISETATSTQ